MKISKTNFYNTIFAVIILLQIFLPSFKANIFLQIVVLGIFFSLDKVLISNQFLKIIVPIIILFFIGFIGMLLHKHFFFNITKDIFHFVKPILGIMIGYLFYKKINNFKRFIKTIVYCGLVSALIHFLYLFITGNIFSGSISVIRESNKDSFLELFALFFLLFYKKFQEENLFRNKNNFVLIKYILIFSCILYFSRTMLICALMLMFSIKGYTKITTKTIKIVSILLVSIALFYAFLFSIKIDRNKPGIETFLYKIKNAPSEIFKTKIDRDNHKDLWDHWRGYEAKRAFELMNNNPSSYFFGCGHGSLVNLKFFAPLSGPNEKGMKYISELHNGYVYLLYKTGFLGLFFYLYTLYLLYIKIYKNLNITNVFISGIGIFYLFTMLTITGFYNSNDTIIFMLGALLFFNSKANNKFI